jgi:hypothetical protein
MIVRKELNMQSQDNIHDLHKAEVQRRVAGQAAKDLPVLPVRSKAPAAAAPVKAELVMAAAAAAVSPWVNHYVGIDVSDWQDPAKMDYKFLAAQGVKFGIAKAFEVQQGVSKSYWAQKKYADHIQGMYDAGMMAGGYMFQNGYSISGENEMYGYTLDAIKNMTEKEDNEFQYTIQALTNKASRYSKTGTLSSWWIDVERWWQSYTEYNQYLQGQRAVADVKVMEALYIMADLQAYINHLTTAMTKGTLPYVPITIYTGKWYTEAYLTSQGQNLFYNAAPGWKNAGITVCVAGYTTPAVVTTWDKILDGTYLPTGTPFDAGFGAPEFWQFCGGNLKLPNGVIANAALDLDLVCTNKGQFDLKYGTGPAVPVDHNCAADETWNEATQQCEKTVVTPVDHGCASDETWNETTQECEKTVVTPSSDALVKLQATADETLAILKKHFIE